MSLEETIQRVANRDLPPNEETAIKYIIDPILEDLGWDVRNIDGNSEVEYERSVGPGRGAKKEGRADIALMKVGRGGKRECVCLVEAKAPGKKLRDHIDQLVNYAFHEGVDLCVLTNAKEWWLYLPREKGPIDDRRFAEIKLADDPEQIAAELEHFLSKENVINGTAEDRAKKRIEALKDADILNTELPKILDQLTRDHDPELVELIIRRASSSTGLSPSPEQVARVLDRARVLDGKSIPNTPSRKPDLPLPSTKASKLKVPSIKTPKPRKVVLNGAETEVKQWRELLLVVANSLYERHKHEFYPLVTDNWRTRKIPISLIKSDFRSADQLNNTPYWINTWWSAYNLLRIAHELLLVTGGKETDLSVFNSEGVELVRDSKLRKIIPLTSQNG